MAPRDLRCSQTGESDMASVLGAGRKQGQNTTKNIDRSAGTRSRFAPASQACANGVSDISVAEMAAEEKVDELIEHEILPRLLVALANSRVAGAANDTIANDTNTNPHIVQSFETDAFAPLALGLEAEELMAQIECFLDRGVSAEAVFIELLAPSARKLGEYWEEDRCDFVDVTMGLWRLQEVMREVALRSPVRHNGHVPARSALFTPLPGEQHCFGTLMVEEVFSRAGWDSEALIEPQRAEMLQIVSDREFELVGLTVSNDCPSGELASLVTAIRSVSKCRSVKIIIGGRAVNASPQLATLAGADGTAQDASSALILADGIVPVAKRLDCFEA